MKKFIAPLLAVVLFGFGCGSTPATQTNSAPTPAPAPTPVATTPAPSNEPRMLTVAQTDATWKTYTNAALKFSFMTPTKGRYAPEWEVKIFRPTDSVIVNGCYNLEGLSEGTPELVKVGDTTFCFTHGSDNGAGQHYVLGAYATKIGSSIAVLNFVKHTVNAGNLNCKMPEPYSTSGTTCIPFVESEYYATLDGIVGTFKMNP